MSALRTRRVVPSSSTTVTTSVPRRLPRFDNDSGIALSGFPCVEAAVAQRKGEMGNDDGGGKEQKVRTEGVRETRTKKRHAGKVTQKGGEPSMRESMKNIV